MKIYIHTTDASEPDCRRYDYWASESKSERGDFLAAACCLGNEKNRQEVRDAVESRWPGAEVVWSW